jgi:pilus assembly protein CpaB
MNQRLMAVLAFALVVSGGASFLLYRLLGSRMTPAEGPPAARIPVAARQIEIGQMVNENDIEEAAWAGPVTPDMVVDRQMIAGRGVISTVYKGEPFRTSRLAAQGAGGGLAATIPVGMRAVAIRVNDVVGIAGFATPGMRVDLLILGQPMHIAQQVGSVSKTLLQNIEVLSAGQQIQRDAEGKPIPVPVVNLLVTPEQAEIVSLASNHAQIQLILRNPLDKEESKTKGAVYGRLFGDNPGGGADFNAKPAATGSAPARPRAASPRPAPPPAPDKPAPPPPVVVEILHGAAKARVTFAEKEAK